ncbi:MAG: hypothetical protein FWG57_06120 [Endomicrobia bacterium]|nr:hypothetical protein [Endomicrobiia bacterium]
MKIKKRVKSTPKNSKSYEDFRKEYFSENPEDIELLKESLIEEFNDSEDMKLEELLKALKEVMKLEGISKVAKKTKLSRENLHRSFAEDGNPTIKTVSKIVDCLGYRVKLVHSSSK